MRRQGQEYTFLFPSLRDYHAAKAMLDSSSNMGLFFLKKENFNILAMLAEVAAADVKVQEYLLNIIRSSGNPTANANALSILAKANLLRGKNFSNCLFSAKAGNSDHSIAVQGPYLAGTDLRDVELSQADLCGANFRGAYLWRKNLEKSRLDGADMTGVIWETPLVANEEGGAEQLTVNKNNQVNSNADFGLTGVNVEDGITSSEANNLEQPIIGENNQLNSSRNQTTQTLVDETINPSNSRTEVQQQNETKDTGDLANLVTAAIVVIGVLLIGIVLFRVVKLSKKSIKGTVQDNK